MNNQPNCETCIFWKKDDESYGYTPPGTCRRSAPVGLASLVKISDHKPSKTVGAAYSWPITLSTDWCGEHATPLPEEPKEDELPEPEED